MNSNQRRPFSDYYTDEEAESRARQQVSLAASVNPSDAPFSAMSHDSDSEHTHPASAALASSKVSKFKNNNLRHCPPPTERNICILNVVDNNTYVCPQAAEGTVCWTSHARAAQLLLSAAATATANAMEDAGGGGVHTIYMCSQTTIAIYASSYYYMRVSSYS